MFCSKCGARLAENIRFCSNCGSAQATPVTFADKVRSTAKKVSSSPAFLIATICFTIALLLDLLTLQPASSIYATSGDLFPALQPDTLETLTLVAGAISLLPGILIAIGLWITYGACCSRKSQANTAGLTMIFVVTLVALILSSLVLLGVLALMTFVYYTEPWQLNGPDAVLEKAVCQVIILSLAVIFVFVLLFSINICSTVSNVRNTLKTGKPNRRASRFIGIICYISGVFMVLSGVGDLFNANDAFFRSFYYGILPNVLPSTYFLFGISSLLSATALILFGALIFTYRNKMATLEAEERMNTFKTLSYAEPYTSPVYIPPQPAIPKPKTAEGTAEAPVEETE